MRAKTLGISRNRLILEALEEKVGARDEWAPELVQMLADPVPLRRRQGAGREPRRRAQPSLVSQGSAEALRYVLDTTVASALMRAEPGPSSRLLQKRPADVLLPQPAVAEIRYGLARLPSSRRKRELERRLVTLLAALARAEWSDEVSRCFGDLKAELERRGERVDDFDLAIAAHAIAHDATVVTRNTRHFARIRSLRVEDWT